MMTVRTARVVSVPVGDEARTADRYHEYWGGLGDIVNHIYWLPCYRALSTLKSGERAFLVVSSHNPHAKEIFLWHPKAEQITVCDLGFHCGFQDPATRDPLRLRRDGCMHGFPFTPVEFHGPPDDDPVHVEVAWAGRYVVFAPGSAERDKFVPQEIVNDAVERTLGAGFRIVLVGRNYVHHNYGLETPRSNWRAEVRLRRDREIVDTVDRLSVPGVLRVISGATGVFTAHSAGCMAAYHMKKPTFVLYNEHAKRTYLPKSPGEPFQGYFHGAGNPGCDNAWFPEYTGDRMDRWLARLKEILK